MAASSPAKTATVVLLLLATRRLNVQRLVSSVVALKALRLYCTCSSCCSPVLAVRMMHLGMSTPGTDVYKP